MSERCNREGCNKGMRSRKSHILIPSSLFSPFFPFFLSPFVQLLPRGQVRIKEYKVDILTDGDIVVLFFRV